MRLLLLVGCLLGLACNGRYSRSNRQIESSIAVHGGSEAYQSLHALRVVKTIRLFEASGDLESETRQYQVLRPLPGAGSSIGWKSQQGLVRVTDHGGEFQYTLNDSLHIGPEWKEKVRSTIDGAKFVLFQPFKLKADGIRLRQVGNRELDGFGEVRMYRLDFQQPTFDRWYFYFDNKDRLVANEVVQEDRRSLIENLEFQEFQGLLLHKHRKSYFVDSLHKERILRAEYFYEYPE